MYTLRIRQQKEKTSQNKNTSDSGNKKELSVRQQDKALKLARKLEKNYSEKNIKKVDSKKNKYFNSNSFSKIKDKAEYLWEKLKAHETPLSMKLAIFGGFAYMILPVDIIPDTIPVFGLVDDASVLYAIWKTTYPYLKEVAKDIIDEKGMEIIQGKINSSFKRTIIRAAIILLINVVGTLLVCFYPFGMTISLLISSVLFLASFIYSLIRFILFWKNNGRLIFGISKQTIKAKNMNQGIANYIRTADEKNCRTITKIFKIVDLANRVPNANIPNLEAVIRHFIKKIRAEIFIFAGFYGLYLLLIFGFLKPYLIHEFAQMNTLQLMIYPIYQLYSLITVFFKAI